MYNRIPYNLTYLLLLFGATSALRLCNDKDNCTDNQDGPPTYEVNEKVYKSDSHLTVISTDQEKNDFGMIDIPTVEYKPAFDRNEETVTNPTVHIRRSDKVNGNTFYISQVTAEFLQKVLELETAPEYLKSESTGLIVKIDPSSLEPNEFYVVKGPGAAITSRMRKIRNRGETTNSSPKREYNIPVLSGSVHIGQLYDAKANELLYDRYLWKSPIAVNEADVTSVETDVYIEENVVDRLNHLGVSAGLSIEFVAGPLMFELSGAASYLKDEIETDEHVRMTFSYAKKGKQLTAKSSESVQDSDMCEKSLGATHVVTEVKYGFNAFLLFEKKVTTDMSKQEIAGSLKIALSFAGLPLSIEGYGAFNYTTSVTEVMNTLSFTFYGDAVIDPPPQTYEDAIAVYKQLPNKSIENERIVSFSVAPLSDYCTIEDDILNDIESSNVEAVSNMIVDFEDVDKMFRKLKNFNLPLDFQRYRALLLDLERRFEVAKTYFKSKILTLLPLIRSGDEEAPGELTELLEEYNESPYEKERFLSVLYTRQKEIETAEFIIYHEDLPNNKFIDFDHTGDMAECIIGHEYALVYELEILPEDISNIGALHESGTLDETDKWFMDEMKVGENRPLMHDFIALAQTNIATQSASICFLVSLNQIGESEQSFQLSLLKEGKTLVENFQAPEKIGSMVVVDRKVDQVGLQIDYKENDALESSSLHYDLKATYEKIDNEGTVVKGPFQHMQTVDMSLTSSIMTLEKLDAGSAYKASFSFSLFEGSHLISEGHNSDEFYFFTTPSSPPSSLACDTTSDSLTLTWRDPTIGMELQKSYQFDYRLVAGESDNDPTEGSTASYSYDGTNKEHTKAFSEHIFPVTTYEFGVKLIDPIPFELETSEGTHVSNMESKAATIKCYTKPRKLSGLVVSAITHDSVTISWDEYHTMEEKQFRKYLIQVKKAVTHDTHYPESLVTNHVVTNLEPGVGYQISVQVVTVDFGNSEWSDMVPVTTQTNSESELSEIEQLNLAIQQYQDEVNARVLQVETNSQTTDTRLEQLSQTTDTRLEQLSQTTDTRLEQLETNSQTTDTRLEEEIAELELSCLKTDGATYIDLNQRVDQCEQKSQELDTRLIKEETHIWFDATRTTNTPGADDVYVVKYSTARESENSGISTSTGKFECTRKGAYKFHFIGQKQQDKYGWIRMMKNGSTQKFIGSNDMKKHVMSLTAILELVPGDKVWIETEHQLNSAITFTGFLLEATD